MLGGRWWLRNECIFCIPPLEWYHSVNHQWFSELKLDKHKKSCLSPRRRYQFQRQPLAHCGSAPTNINGREKSQCWTQVGRNFRIFVLAGNLGASSRIQPRTGLYLQCRKRSTWQSESQSMILPDSPACHFLTHAGTLREFRQNLGFQVT